MAKENFMTGIIVIGVIIGILFLVSKTQTTQMAVQPYNLFQYGMSNGEKSKILSPSDSLSGLQALVTNIFPCSVPGYAHCYSNSVTETTVNGLSAVSKLAWSTSQDDGLGVNGKYAKNFTIRYSCNENMFGTSKLYNFKDDGSLGINGANWGNTVFCDDTGCSPIAEIPLIGSLVFTKQQLQAINPFLYLNLVCWNKKTIGTQWVWNWAGWGGIYLPMNDVVDCVSNANCQAGSTCVNNACVQPVCGNSIIETGELCDGGSQSCTLNGYSGTQACNSQCNGYGVCAVTQYCGDGTVNGPESCELSGSTSTQSCTLNGYSGIRNCQSCIGYGTCTTTQSCGDNIKNGPEVCDGTDLAGNSCTTFGYTGGTLSCNSACSGFVKTACTSPPVQTCGNNIIEGTEVCDGTALGGNSCTTFGYTGGTLSCNSACSGFVKTACTSPPVQTCGNNIIEGTELCDGGSQSCTLNGYSGTQSCNSQCNGYNACTTTQSCGDNIKNGPEVCDGTDLAGNSCTTFGYTGGTLSCNSACSGFVKTACTSPPVQTCGNNIIEGTEVCDGTALGTQTCPAGTTGSVSCNSACSGYITSNCIAAATTTTATAQTSPPSQVQTPTTTAPTTTALRPSTIQPEAKVIPSWIPILIIVMILLALGAYAFKRK